jgi:hypothetical protein
MRRIALLLAAVLGLGSLVFVLLQSRGPVETVDAVPTGAAGSSEEAAIPDLAVGKADHQGERQSALPAAVAADKPERESVPVADSFVRGDLRARNRNGGECFITGKLVDPRGEPVSDVSLSSLDDVLGPSQRLPTDGNGRFSGWVWALDEATLIFTKANVGQSEPMEVVTNAAPVLDLGTIWLIEEGTIEGRVQLADGTPVPSVEVAGTTRSRGSSGGLDATITRTRDDGSFTLSGLCRGHFDLTMAGDDPYPLAAEVRAATHDRGVILEVEALLLVVRCINEEGEPVPFQRVSKTLPGSTVTTTISGEPYRNTPAVESMVVHAAVGQAHRLQAKAGDGRVYTAVVDKALSPGLHDVDLRAVSKDRSRVTLRVPKRGGLGEDRLRVVSLKVDGQRLEALSRENGFHPTALNVVLDGLEKGSYELECELAGTGFEVLSVPVRRFQLAPPKDQLLEFKRVQGGRIDLTFTTGPEFRGWMPCTVRIKEEEEPDSSYRSFTRVLFPPRGLGQVSVAPGLTVQSRAFPPGRYTIHLQSDGHLPAVANAEIKPGKVTAVEVALEADPAAAPKK